MLTTRPPKLSLIIVTFEISGVTSAKERKDCESVRQEQTVQCCVLEVQITVVKKDTKIMN
jgi:hypothetical protein